MILGLLAYIIEHITTFWNSKCYINLVKKSNDKIL